MRILFVVAVVMMLVRTGDLTAQACAGSTAGRGQLGLAGLWSGSSDAYGLDLHANLPGPVSAALGYTYSGVDRTLHAVNGRLGYELSNGRLSFCPSLGARYTNGAYVSRSVDPSTHPATAVEASWRTIAAPATLDVGLRIPVPGGAVLIPSASAGGMLWHFQGRNAYHMIDGRVQDRGSQLAWVGSAGLTLGWSRLFLTGSASETSLPLAKREWSLSAGWLFR